MIRRKDIHHSAILDPMFTKQLQLRRIKAKEAKNPKEKKIDVVHRSQ